MNHPVLLGSTLTDDEFKHLRDLTGFIKCPPKKQYLFLGTSKFIYRM